MVEINDKGKREWGQTHEVDQKTKKVFDVVIVSQQSFEGEYFIFIDGDSKHQSEIKIVEQTLNQNFG